MLGLVGHVRAEVTANNHVPRWVVLLVELLLDERCDVLLNVVLLECLCGTIDGILLHVLGHVRILDHRLPVSHCCSGKVGSSGVDDVSTIDFSYLASTALQKKA
eukprot:TRINITY_DN1886_c0_g1_i5.p1 TRINITY_DN1886_c0_g1~~TRINITY_DN1886_c0_g1_i5.p1  ORF type:complete len:104 (-),score=7.34 TRINITY_DN1886_c0_g1_i5:22-333(-)